MKRRCKLAVFDLDGTLFDTKNVNFHAYQRAIKESGFDINIDYQYYCDFCNGNHYKVFIPQIIPEISEEALHLIHERKKVAYADYLDRARKNDFLFFLIDSIRDEYAIALVTTASRKNTQDILEKFSIGDCFDITITQEDVEKTKPSPECFLKAMKEMGISPEGTIIFEDSDTGIEAAKRSGAKYMRVYGYN